LGEVLAFVQGLCMMAHDVIGTTKATAKASTGRGLAPLSSRPCQCSRLPVILSAAKNPSWHGDSSLRSEWQGAGGGDWPLRNTYSCKDPRGRPSHHSQALPFALEPLATSKAFDTFAYITPHFRRV